MAGAPFHPEDQARAVIDTKLEACGGASNFVAK
jgi:hypothetical protein